MDYFSFISNTYEKESHQNPSDLALEMVEIQAWLQIRIFVGIN